MTGKDDVVAGCVTDYDFEAIRPWVNSLDRCGFTGRKIMLAYNLGADAVRELLARGYTVLPAGESLPDGGLRYQKKFSVVVERFFHLWALLKGERGRYRFLIHTDVKDVVFQRNPSAFLEQFLVPSEYKIHASSESIRYQHEDWGRENLTASFGPEIYEDQKDEIIVNAGTLSGEFDTMLDFFLTVYLTSVGAGTENPDQAAVNVLLTRSPYKEISVMSSPLDAWACQAGTTHDPQKLARYRRLFPEPADAGSYMDEAGCVRNIQDEAFVLVHQYDRVPAWRDRIRAQYGD